MDPAAPSLLPYEVLNALKRSGIFGEEELKEIAETLDDYKLTLHELEGELASRTTEIAMRRGLAVYDASYAVLASTLGAALYTAGWKLARKAGPHRAKNIRLNRKARPQTDPRRRRARLLRARDANRRQSQHKLGKIPLRELGAPSPEKQNKPE